MTGDVDEDSLLVREREYCLVEVTGGESLVDGRRAKTVQCCWSVGGQWRRATTVSEGQCRRSVETGDDSADRDGVYGRCWFACQEAGCLSC